VTTTSPNIHVVILSLTFFLQSMSSPNYQRLSSNIKPEFVLFSSDIFKDFFSSANISVLIPTSLIAPFSFLILKNNSSDFSFFHIYSPNIYRRVLEQMPANILSSSYLICFLGFGSLLYVPYCHSNSYLYRHQLFPCYHVQWKLNILL
jgi:hypothetical protein